MFSTGLACSDGSCTFQNTGDFDADCTSGSMNDYVYCLTEMNCPNDDISDMISTQLSKAYPDDCLGTQVFNISVSDDGK